MKITKYLYLIFIINMYLLNYLLLKINVFMFTGIVLATLIVLVIGINIYLKFKNKREGLHSEDFIFSPEVAKTLKKVDIGIQYESSMIATFFLIVGLLFFTIYTVFFTPYNIVMKIFITFNSLFAMLLMASMLVTSYQQFISYRESRNMFTQFIDKTDNKLSLESAPMQTMQNIIKEEFIVKEEKFIVKEEDDIVKKTFERRKINE